MSDFGNIEAIPGGLVMEAGALYVKLGVSGLVSASLYFLLFFYEREILVSFTRTDGFYPVLPIVAAFIFSFAHGAFTAYFWEALGVTGRRPSA